MYIATWHLFFSQSQVSKFKKNLDVVNDEWTAEKIAMKQLKVHE